MNLVVYCCYEVVNSGKIELLFTEFKKCGDEEFCSVVFVMMMKLVMVMLVLHDLTISRPLMAFALEAFSSKGGTFLLGTNS